jgi:hypothetical protein
MKTRATAKKAMHAVVCCDLQHKGLPSGTRAKLYGPRHLKAVDIKVHEPEVVTVELSSSSPRNHKSTSSNQATPIISSSKPVFLKQSKSL